MGTNGDRRLKEIPFVLLLNVLKRRAIKHMVYDISVRFLSSRKAMIHARGDGS